jgi:hypothetical protein
MDRTFTDIQRNDENAAQSAPHLVEISIVPPERTATDEPMPPQSPPRATEPGAEKKRRRILHSRSGFCRDKPPLRSTPHLMP